MHSIQAVAFDLDGTLIDSKPSIVYGLQSLLETLGLPPVDKLFLRRMIGAPLTEIFLALGIGVKEYEHHRSIYSEFMFEHMHVNLRAFPEINEVIAILKGAGYQLAIVTSRGRDSLGPCLSIAGINESMFDLTIARDDTLTHKPAAEPLLKAIEKFSCLSEQLVYVGDALVDVECAMAAGCHAVYASYDADQKLETQHRVLAEINSMYELVSLFPRGAIVGTNN